MREQTTLPVQFTAHKPPSFPVGRGSGPLDSGTRPAARGNDRPTPLVESLERRICFAAVGAVFHGVSTGIVPWLIPHRTGTPPAQDLNDQIGEAQLLGAAGSSQSVGDTLTSATDVNMYALSVQANQQVAFDIDTPAGSTLDSELRLFDASGNELTANDNGTAPGEGASNDSYLQFKFPTAGTYYVGVSGSGNIAYNAVSGAGDSIGTVGANGAYVLNVSVVSGGGSTTQLSGTASLNGQSTPVTITRFDAKAIDPTARSWLLIHGRNGNGHTTGLTSIYNTIHAQFPSDQVLTLDWSQAAAAPTYFDAEQWIPAVGQTAAQLLSGDGFTGAQLNVIGYSFGTYVGGETAKALPGGSVNTMALIDPPQDAPGGYDANASLDFTQLSNFAWAFHDTAGGGTSTHSASNVTPTKTDEAIDVAGTTHGAIIALFNNLISGTSPAAQRFHLSRLLSGTRGPWRLDAFDATGQMVAGGGYEALINTTGGGTVAQSLEYVNGSGQDVLE